MPNITRGGSTLRLLRYLAGMGRREEHQRPHLVAGQPGAVLVEHGGRVLSARDLGPIAALLDEPMNDTGTEVTIAERDGEGKPTGSRRAAHVWHCSLALHPDEPELDDDTWRRIAERYVALLGFDPLDGPPACRWVAVRHGRSAGGSDHVHVVVNLVREGGKAASVHMDQRRAQEACRKLEQEFGLRQVEGRGRGAGERGVKPAELAARRPNRTRDLAEQLPTSHTARRRLERVVRACATAATDEHDFVSRLRSEGLLVRPRFEQGGINDIVGYSVAIRPTDQAKPVWFGGGRLSRELTLPRLRAAWPEVHHAGRAAAWQRASPGEVLPTAPPPPTPELQAQQCARQLAELRERLQSVRDADQTTWALIARDAAGLLAAWSLRTETEPGPLAEAGRAIARTAQLRAAQVPNRPHRPFPPTQNAARLLLRAANGPPTGVLLSQIASLAEAIHDMHAAAGDAQRATELKRTALRHLAAVTSTPEPTVDRMARELGAALGGQRRSPTSLRMPPSRDVER